ncbi:macro domain-containing protein [Paenibacillus sp. WQ 127069]|uniref:Macro domain-containing protein n=1 Tax=Paenibacillus baimaensis TaxID=2982185 RepID=A0ABT2UCL2_9BACL|nr:macro domain-containing protein [Paenibacillus sp. WQ 127069]MCU6792374.1 macro domain-containing protein [Paenibacillus sp. WQ 127069]
MIIVTTRIVKSDLLRASEHIIAHQVNCQAVMGSGVAKQIKHHYPKVYTEYLQFCHQNKENLLGLCQFVALDQGSTKYVANLFGQQDFGRDGKKYTNDDALRNALNELCKFAKTNKYSIAFPYGIGCNRGGGDWSVVSKMINDIFKDEEVTLYKFTP